MLRRVAHRPLTPTLSREYRGKGVCSLSRLRERAGVRVARPLSHVAAQAGS
jgi:hypothetical protein